MKFRYGVKQILACATAFVIAASIVVSNGNQDYQIVSEASYQNQINKYQEQLEEYKKQQEALDAQLQANKNNLQNELAYQKDIQNQITNVEGSLKVLSDYIFDLKTDIKTCEDDIAVKEAEIEKKTQEIAEGKDAFLQRLRAMYIAGDDTYASVLIGATDFYDMLMKVELVKRVAGYDKQVIDELYDLKKQLEAEEEALEIKKGELEATLEEYNTQKTEQENQRVKLQDLYEESERKADQFKNDIDQSEHDHDELAGEMLDLEDIIADLVAKEEERKKQEALQQQQQQQKPSGGNNNNGLGGTFGGDIHVNGSGVFAWPVPGFYHVTSGIGWRWGSYHKGIDISSYGIRGANITASDSGTVVKVNNSCRHDWGKSGSCGCGGGYGNYCIINHGNGYMTLYAHAQYMNVSVGQQVSQGQTLGIIGSTGWSTGDHLHFEVRLNGTAVNPLDYV
ncbi:MAG: hypothetical protein E7509_06500 [Ruminococcus sp.]|nr:hypothetical protein [Ruminococcus sp.]